jgi:hypothetical protein
MQRQRMVNAADKTNANLAFAIATRIKSLLISSGLWLSTENTSNEIVFDSDGQPFDEILNTFLYDAIAAGSLGKAEETNLFQGNVSGFTPRSYLNLFFNESWYFARYPQTRKKVLKGDFVSGLHHYLEEGIFCSYTPSWWFDESYYLNQYPAVASLVSTGGGGCGFLHFLESGIHEGYSPHWIYNANYYSKKFPEIFSQFGYAGCLRHYILREDPSVEGSLLFKPSWYQESYSQLLSGHLFKSVEEHYTSVGINSALSPNPYFNERDYRNRYLDVGEAIQGGTISSGVQHFVQYGCKEGRFANFYEPDVVGFTSDTSAYDELILRLVGLCFAQQQMIADLKQQACLTRQSMLNIIQEGSLK